MRISGIRNQTSFTAGKVNLYTDFDGTYCPAKHSTLHDPNANGFMNEYCNRINKFWQTTNGDVHFNITTGRTLGEYESISWLLKMRNFRLPFPETIITKDGSDRFVKTGTDTDFYEQGKFPFNYHSPQKEKETEIKNLTNWDGDKIHAKLKRLANKYKIRLVEADSENAVSDYGERSLFSSGKLDPDDWKKLPSQNGQIIEHTPPVADYVLGSRNDGKLKFNLIFPPDYGFCPERNWIYDNIVTDLKGYLDSKKIRYHMEWEPASDSNHHRISCSITPLFENGALTKLYDTKKALKEAVKNNDIVIAAGDGSNDFDMLNPLGYLEEDFIKECEKNSSHKEFYSKDITQRLEDLKRIYNGENSEYINGLRKELKQNGYLKQLEDLPIYSIVIRKQNSKMQPLIDTFSRINKVIVTENGSLDEGIKKIIKLHAEKNKAFKSAMSEKFKILIFGAKKKSAQTVNYYKIGAGILLAGLIGFIGFKYLNKKSEEKDNENNTGNKSSNSKS